MYQLVIINCKTTLISPLIKSTKYTISEIPFSISSRRNTLNLTIRFLQQGTINSGFESDEKKEKQGVESKVEVELAKAEVSEFFPVDLTISFALQFTLLPLTCG